MFVGSFIHLGTVPDMAMRRRAVLPLCLVLLAPLCFVAWPSRSLRRKNAASRLCAVASLQEMVQPVADFAGNGTAFVLREDVLPDVAPQETRRFDVPGFSPGFVMDGVISTEDCQKVVQLCEDIGFRTRWSQVGAVTLFMPEDFSNRIFERLKLWLRMV
eukprot:Skav221062  [mRNA]  locus=scaffold3118:98199:102397:- [translate_table: standard]